MQSAGGALNVGFPVGVEIELIATIAWAVIVGRDGHHQMAWHTDSFESGQSLADYRAIKVAQSVAAEAV